MTALNTLLILLTAVCIPGLINRTRAVLAGRRGIRFAQHLYDVRLLLRKGAVYSCLLYTSDAADERSSGELGGRRIIKKNK